MKKRVLMLFLRAGFVAVLLALLSSALLCQEGGPQDTVHSRPRPEWLSETPLVIVSNHDSLPIFQRRRGGNPTWQEEDYEKEHTEEAVEKLKQMG